MIIKHNNKKHNIPTKASELPYKDFLKVREWDGIHEAEFIEKLLGVDYSTALEITDGYLKESDFDFFRDVDYKKPEKIEIFGKKYKVKSDLFNESTAGQIAIFKMLLSSMDKDSYATKIYDLLPEILAIYFYPMVRSTVFNSRKYKEIIYLIEDCSYKDVLSIGFFLLMNLTEYQRLKNKDLGKEVQNKLKQELTD